MLFETVSAGARDRLRLCSLLLNHVNSVENSSDAFSDDLSRMQKGLFFVQLYAAIEFTVINSFSNFLELISQKEIEPRDFEPALLSVLLDSNFKALLDSGKKNLWKKKVELLQKVFSQESCDVNTSIFPSSAMNIAHAEICDLWFFLGLDGSPLPEGVFPQLLMEIKEHRNAIAHGRECSQIIGARYSLEQLRIKHSSIELLCHYIISSIESHYDSKFSA